MRISVNPMVAAIFRFPVMMKDRSIVSSEPVARQESALARLREWESIGDLQSGVRGHILRRANPHCKERIIPVGA